MGVFSWLSSKKPEPDPLPSDYEIASRVASLIEAALQDSSMGLAELLKPNCAAVLDHTGRVSLRWPQAEKPQQFADIMTFALIPQLANFKSFAKSCIELAKTGDNQSMQLWYESMGRIEIDQIATQALRTMKSNAEKKRRADGDA